MTFHAGEI
jgi:hypothetical protein